MCDNCARCLVFRKRVSLDDFKDVEINFLDQIEKEFENQ